MSAFERPIKLAVFFDQEIAAGGGYHQAINAAALVAALPRELCEPLFVAVRRDSIAVLKPHGIDAVHLGLSRWRIKLLKWRARLNSPRLIALLRGLFGDNAFDRFFAQYDVDLIYFTSPSEFAFLTERFNFIFTVWDLCHRDNVEFPEVRGGREFERREEMYRNLVPKASATLVDAERSREALARRYGVDQERVYVMPFAPAQGIATAASSESSYADVKSRYGLRVDYVFYPAQFWAHKNHVYVLRGLKTLEEKHGLKIAAVFAGGDAGGNRRVIEACSADLGLSDRVRFVGLVGDDEIPYLYRQSIALVMPTYFGPTNIPPLEAFRLGTPVMYSDLPGLREQVGDAALLMDLDRPESMADHLHALVHQSGLRESLVDRGRRRLELCTDANRLPILERILNLYRSKRDTWMQLR